MATVLSRACDGGLMSVCAGVLPAVRVRVATHGAVPRAMSSRHGDWRVQPRTSCPECLFAGECVSARAGFARHSPCCLCLCSRGLCVSRAVEEGMERGALSLPFFATRAPCFATPDMTSTTAVSALSTASVRGLCPLCRA